MADAHIYIWGFPEGEPTSWPDDLKPETVDKASWPTGAPVLVHVGRWEAFRDWFNSEDGTASDTVLYLPPGAEEPDEAWAYFDGTIQAEDGDALHRLAYYPKQYYVQQWAGDAPASVLDALHRHDPDYDRLPDLEPIQHLLQDTYYREQFEQALQEREQVRRQVLGFTEAQLTDYVLGNMDAATSAEVEQFLEESASARAVVDMLRITVGPARAAAAVIRVNIPLVQVLGMWKTRRDLMRRHPAVRTRGRTSKTSMFRLQPFMEELQAEKSKPLGGGDFRLRYKDARHVVIDEVPGKGKLSPSAFWVELRREDEEVFAVQSIGGRAELAIGDLAEALENGADSLAIIAGP